MYISDEMERYLYRKKYFAGMIVDLEEDMWFDLSDEWLQLKETFKRGTIIEVVDKLVQIFNIGHPNDTRLSTLFGTGYEYVQGGLIAMCGLEEAHKTKEDFEKKYGKGKAGLDNGDKILGVIYDIEREYSDIIKVEMDIDIECLKINNLYLYLDKQIDKNLLKRKMKQIDTEIIISDDKALIIAGKDYRIIIS